MRPSWANTTFRQRECKRAASAHAPTAHANPSRNALLRRICAIKRLELLEVPAAVFMGASHPSSPSPRPTRPPTASRSPTNPSRLPSRGAAALAWHSWPRSHSPTACCSWPRSRSCSPAPARRPSRSPTSGCRCSFSPCSLARSSRLWPLPLVAAPSISPSPSSPLSASARCCRRSSSTATSPRRTARPWTGPSMTRSTSRAPSPGSPSSRRSSPSHAHAHSPRAWPPSLHASSSPSPNPWASACSALSTQTPLPDPSYRGRPHHRLAKSSVIVFILDMFDTKRCS